MLASKFLKLAILQRTGSKDITGLASFAKISGPKNTDAEFSEKF